MFNGIYAGGPVLIKHHPGVRCCGRRDGPFCNYVSPPAGSRNCKEKR